MCPPLESDGCVILRNQPYSAANVAEPLALSTLQEQYDEAMFAFSQGDFAGAMAKLRAVLAD